MSDIEQETRYMIDTLLKDRGWILSPKNSSRNVYFEGAVKDKLSAKAQKSLGAKRPDYTLFHGSIPIAVIEAKKPSTPDLRSAMEQARDYAERIGNIPFIFACNGSSLKAQHLSSLKPLYIDGVEITEFPTLDTLLKFKSSNSNTITTIDEVVVKDRHGLIAILDELNEELRNNGIRAGYERFIEIANFLFLKLLSEKDSEGKKIWNNLMSMPDDAIIGYINGKVVDALSKKYGGEVIEPTIIESTESIKLIVNRLSGLTLVSVNEDIKGTAFEHFITKSANTHNDLGEYYTPRHIIRFMTDILDPQFGETVYDPFCGTGGFLVEAFRYISKKCNMTRENFEILQRKSLFGGEITNTARLAKMNMILFGDGHSGVEKQNSIDANTKGKYDNVLTNIPFSQKIKSATLDIDGEKPENSDAACVRKCFEALKDGGNMAIIVPEGILVNRQNKNLLRFLFKKSRVRMFVRLPRGCFAPYTEARAAIIYLTDKNRAETDWFYEMTIKNDGYDSKRNPIDGINDLDESLFYYSGRNKDDVEKPPHAENPNIRIIEVRSVDDKNAFHLRREWKKNGGNYERLDSVANLQNGNMITESTASGGHVPVIGGGKGTIPYFHDQYNFDSGITVSKSGAYAGYIWWHDEPVWASDCIRIKSKDEKKVLTRFIYICMLARQDELYERQQGVGQPHIYISHVEDMPIPSLPISGQKKIIREFDGIEKKRKKIEQDLKVNEEEKGVFVSSISKIGKPS